MMKGDNLMYIQVNKISEQGRIIEPVIVLDTDVLSSDLISVPVPEGLYAPYWNGTEWVEGSMPDGIIQQERNRKKLHFKELCEAKIEEGFISSNGHHYRTNRDDQTNMIGQKHELMDNLSISEVMWKTEDSGYISHTREEWMKVYSEALQHKKEQLFKYDRLKSELDLLTDPDAITNKKWE